MVEVKMKVVRRRECFDEEQWRRARIKEFIKTVGKCAIVVGVVIGAYSFGKRSYGGTV